MSSAFDPSAFCVNPGSMLREVIETLNGNGHGIALVIDDDRRLVATVTDGDIRRAHLRSADLDTPIDRVIADGGGSTGSTEPIVASPSTEPAELLRLMSLHGLRQLPLVDGEGRLEDLALLRDLVAEFELPMRALVMAGGLGTRIHPLTADTPKPMLPVGDRPLMEEMIDRLRTAGIKKVNIAMHHLPDRITEHFGDGAQLGVALNYVTEDLPLGTAGALRLIEESEEPILVMNGDILTSVDFGALLAYHQAERADLTVAVRRFGLPVPYGVVEVEGHLVTDVVEKPTVDVLVNAGIYLLEPRCIHHVPPGERFDMTDLIQRVIADNGVVTAFHVHEYWIDIGTHSDYARVQADFSGGSQ